MKFEHPLYHLVNQEEQRLLKVPVVSRGGSGDPRSPHYDDLLESWADDGSLPLLYSRKAVEKHASKRIGLVPE